MEIKKANKCYVIDKDGNKFIDTTMGSGTQTFLNYLISANPV